MPSYFLEIFGRPERTSPCECGRASEPTMAQALHLMNAPEIEAKLANPTGRAAKLAASSATSEQIAEDLTLAALGRLPNLREREVAASLFTAAPRDQAAADYLWTLLNSRDFLLNH
ncbi:MAG: S-layer protein, partial [Pirellulaceae bacterium]